MFGDFTTLCMKGLNDINVKKSWNRLRCKYQLKLITTTRENMLQQKKNYTLRKVGLKSENPNFEILCKIAFCDKQKWLNKKLIKWSGLAK